MVRNPELLNSIPEMLDFLGIGKNRFYGLRHKYAKTIPCPIFKIPGRGKYIWMTRVQTEKNLLRRWYWQVVKEENKERARRLGRKYKHF